MSSPHTAILTLALLFAAAGCYHERDYSPTAPSNIFLTLRTDPTTASIPADGVSRITIIASISSQADPSSRTIDFDTTSGTFVGGTGSSATSRQVVATTAGDATIQLQSSSTADTAVVTVHADAAPSQLATLRISFTPPPTQSQLAFTAAPSFAPADGASISTFVVSVPNISALPPAARVVVFETTAGGFLPDGGAKTTVAVDDTGGAKAFLRSPTASVTGRVRASNNNAITDAFITFTVAAPDSLQVTSDKFALKPTFDDVATLTVQLRRQIGAPTAGQAIILSAKDSQGSAIGTFSAPTILSDSNGQATSKYNAGGSGYKGPITITATAGALSGSTVIQLISP
jgi:hypothetical protein